MWKHLLHDGTCEWLGVHHHFRNRAILSEVPIERTPRRAQLFEGAIEQLDARLVTGIRYGADFLNFSTNGIKAGIELIDLFARRNAQAAFPRDLAKQRDLLLVVTELLLNRTNQCLPGYCPAKVLESRLALGIRP